MSHTTPITMTTAAVEAATLAMHEEDPNPAGIRVAVVGGGCSGYSYTLAFVEDDEVDEEDLHLQFEGLNVYMDPHSSNLLSGTEIDYVIQLQQRGFVFNNPNASTTCGCGMSFS